MNRDHCPIFEEKESIEERFVKRLERMRIREYGHAKQTGMEIGYDATATAEESAGCMN